MMRMFMCHDVWKCIVLAGENKIPDSYWRQELNSSFLLGMTNECNKFVGEDNFVGE